MMIQGEQRGTGAGTCLTRSTSNNKNVALTKYMHRLKDTATLHLHHATSLMMIENRNDRPRVKSHDISTTQQKRSQQL